MEAVIHFLPSRRELRVPVGTNLLEAVRRAGLPIAASCGAGGACGRCGVRIVAGGEALAAETRGEAEVKRRNRVDAELRLACRIEVTGALTITTGYW